MVMASTLSGTLFFSQPPRLFSFSSRFPTSKNSPVLSPSSNKPFFSSSSCPKSLLSLLRKWNKITALSAAAEAEVEVEEDFKCLDNGKRENLKSVTCDFHLIDEAPESTSSLNGNYSSVCLKHKGFPHSYIYNGIKMTLLIGLLTSQGSQQAIADTEIAGRMQSLDYFGDLGDLNTVENVLLPSSICLVLSLNLHAILKYMKAFLLIFFSELGDKTFFIAALLAARNSSAVVFIGTFGALAAMTIVSVILGRTFHYVDDILPFRLGETDLPIDDIAAVCLLVYFGVTTLLEASSGDGLKVDEEQKEAELAVSELSANGAGIMAAANTIISTFLLVFVAEWGDKSFFSTIALAAASSPLGVIAGALSGHGLATLLAVIGGSLLGTLFSEKVIAYIGGILFLVFAVVTLIETVS